MSTARANGMSVPSSHVSGEQPTTPQPRALTIRRTGVVADLWFAWQSPQRSAEVVLVAVNGTIAGAFPRWVDNGERFPIHRKFLPGWGRIAWFLRVAAAHEAIEGLRVWVELRDARGRTTAFPLCDATTVLPRDVRTIQREVELPAEPIS